MFAVVRTLLFGGVSGKLLGIFREVVSAWLFGTGATAAAFRVANTAFTIPLQGFVSEAMNGGFTPRYALHRRDDPAGAALLFASMHAVVLCLSTLVGGVVFIWADWWIHVLAPGLDASTQHIAVQMVRVMALSMPAYLATGLYAAADLANGHGRLSATRSSVQNVGVLTGTVAAWAFDAPWLIAGGFVAAYVALAIWGVQVSLNNNVSLWPKRREYRAAWARLIEVWVGFRLLLGIPIAWQIHYIVERRVASLLNPAAVVAIDYARFMADTAVILLAMPFGMAGLGTMAVMSASGFRETSARSMRVLLYVGVPLSSILVGNAVGIVQIVFARGAFGSESIATTASILAGLGLGVWAQLIAYAGSKFLSARGENRFVMMTTIAGVAVNVLINLTLANHLGVAILGLSTAANSIVVGLIIAKRVGILRELGPDIASLFVAAALYIALSALLLHLGVRPWLGLAAAAPYWCLAMFATGRHRNAFTKIVETLRH